MSSKEPSTYPAYHVPSPSLFFIPVILILVGMYLIAFFDWEAMATPNGVTYENTIRDIIEVNKGQFYVLGDGTLLRFYGEVARDTTGTPLRIGGRYRVIVKTWGIANDTNWENVYYDFQPMGAG